MAPGIVRAQDRVAVWHQADYDGLTGESTPSKKPDPPKGDTPTPVDKPAVVIPNSNKFKGPANQLKKVLDVAPHPSQGFHPESSQALTDFQQKYPGFNSYLKPNYADAIKAHVGDDNYAKLLHHAPTTITDSLSHHPQQPVPKSNKWAPAKSLKSLLEDKNTQSGHVQQWLSKYPGFASTYFKPSYTDALKSSLGTKQYDELLNHLDDAQHAQLTGKPKTPKQEAKEPEALKAAEPPEVAKTLGEKFEEATGTKYGPAWHLPDVDPDMSQMHIDTLGDGNHPDYELQEQLQQIHDEHFGPQQGEQPGSNVTQTPMDDLKPTTKQPAGAHKINLDTINQAMGDEWNWDTDDPDYQAWHQSLTPAQSKQFAADTGLASDSYEDYLHQQHGGGAATTKDKSTGGGNPKPYDPYAGNPGKGGYDHPYGFDENKDEYSDPYGMNGPPGSPGFQKFLLDNEIDPQNYEWSPSAYGDYANQQQEWAVAHPGYEQHWQHPPPPEDADEDASDPYSGKFEIHQPEDHGKALSKITEDFDQFGIDTDDPKVDGWLDSLDSDEAAHFANHPDDAIDAFQMHDQGGEDADLEEEQDPNAYPGASFAGLSSDELAGYPSPIGIPASQNNGQFGLQPGVAAFLEAQGYGPKEFKKLPWSEPYGGGPSQVGMAKQFKSLDPDQKAMYAEQENVGKEQGGQSPAGGHPSDELWNDIGDMLWGDHGDEEGPVKEQFQQWYDSLDPDTQDAMAGKTVVPYNHFKKWQAKQDEQPPAQALKPGQEGVLNAWMKEHPPNWAADHWMADTGDQYPKFVDWFANNDGLSPQEAAAQIGQSDPEALKTLAHQFDQETGYGQQQDPGTQHPALAQGVAKIFPNATGPNGEPVGDMTDMQIKAMMDHWLKYLPEHEGFTGHVPQLQALYDQFFNKDQPAPPAGEAPDKHQDLLDKINAIKPGWIKQKAWLQNQDENNFLQATMKGWASHPDLTSAQKFQFQQLHDEYFGQQPAAGGSGGTPMAKPSPLSPEIAKDPEAYPGYGQAAWDKAKALAKTVWSGLPDGDLDDWADAHSTPAGWLDGIKYIKESYPDQWQQWSDSHKVEMGYEAPDWLEGNPFKEHYDEYHKLPGGIPDDPVEAEQDFLDWATHNKAGKYPPGFKAWAEDGGVPLSEYSGPELQEAISSWNDSDVVPGGTKQQFIDAEMAHPGGGKAPGDEWNPKAQPAFGDEQAKYGPKPFDSSGLANELGPLLGMDPNEMKHQPSGKWKDMSWNQAKDAMQSVLNQGWPGTDKNKLYALWDKYFAPNGEANPNNANATQQGGGGGLKVKPGAQVPKDLVGPDGNLSDKAIEYLKKNYNLSDDQITKLAPNWDAMDWHHVLNQAASGDKWEDFKNQSGSTGWDKGKTPTTEQLSAAAGKEISPDLSQLDPETFWNSYEYVKKQMAEGNTHWDDLDWGAVVKAIDGASSPGGGGMAYDPKGALADYSTIFPNSPKAKLFDTPEGAKQQLQTVINNATNVGKTEKAKQLQAIYDKWFGGGKADGPPEWDPTAFAEQYKAILPSSGSSLGSGSVDTQKAYDKLTQLISSNPDTPEGKQLQQLKDQWFGKGMPTTSGTGVKAKPVTHPLAVKYPGVFDNSGNPTAAFKNWWKKSHGVELDSDFTSDMTSKLSGDGAGSFWPGTVKKFMEDDDEQSAIQNEQGDLEPPEPAKPFKSQALNPKDLKNWAGSKPQTPGQWKNFATWWGNTKLAPKQEQGLYKAWFGTDVPPEKANGWFHQVFESNSEPGEGDLEATEMPSWVTSSWALGKDADKEWPAFKAWASGDPGLPTDASIKQKMQIWNGLQPEEKAEIGANYAPANPVDTKAVVKALSDAYPDSDWSKWAKMPQGTLAKNVEKLAKAGYVPAIHVFNEHFGGNMDIPEPAPEGEEDKNLPQAKPTIDLDQVPEWAKNHFGKSQQGAKQYQDFYKFADSVGKANDALTGKSEGQKSYYSYPVDLVQAFGKMSQYQKAQFSAMDKVPWDSLEGYQDWMNNQPTLLDEIQDDMPSSAYIPSWMKKPGNYGSQKSYLESWINTQADPQKKANLIAAYQKHFAAGQSTLAEDLKDADPNTPELKGQDWDKYLQTHTPEDIQKLLKKKIKNETDPEKWLKYIAAYKGYFDGPSGHKQVTNALGKGQQALDSSSAKALHYWKTHGAEGSASLPSWYSLQDYEHNSPFIKELEGGGQTTPAKYFGWHPPGDTGGTFTMDPALFGSMGSGTKTYTAPDMATSGELSELKAKAKAGEPEPFQASSFKKDFMQGAPDVFQEYQKRGFSLPNDQGQAKALVHSVLRDFPDLPFWQRQKLEDLYDKHFRDSALSEEDKLTLKTPAFAQWFDKAPPKYRSVMKNHPAIAIDDYHGFQQGHDLYPEVPEGPGKKKHYDLTPWRALPYTVKGDPNTVHFGPKIKYKIDPRKSLDTDYHDDETPYHGWTKNPTAPEDERTELQKNWPVKEETPGQQEFMLPPGETMEPMHKTVELNRGIGINLDADRHKPVKPDKYLKQSDPKEYALQSKRYEKELHRKWLLDQIRFHIKGSGAEDPSSSQPAVPDLFNTYEEKGGPAKAEVPDQWKYGPPGGVDALFAFNDWAKKNDVPPEQMYELAKKWGVTDPGKYGTPPLSEGPWGKGIDPEKAMETDPKFAQLVLDYLEHTDINPSQGFAPDGSMGDHWSTNTSTPMSFANSKGDFRVLMTGDWDGRGEHPEHPHAAFGLGSSEQEISLAPGAPIKIKRVRIHSPKRGWGSHDTDYVDIPVEPHWRYASTSERLDPHKPQHLFHLAQTWKIDSPESYGLPITATTAARNIESAIDLLSGFDDYDPDTDGPGPADIYDERRRPELPGGGERKHHYYSPNQVNPPTDDEARPYVHWDEAEPEQDMLPLAGEAKQWKGLDADMLARHLPGDAPATRDNWAKKSPEQQLKDLEYRIQMLSDPNSPSNMPQAAEKYKRLRDEGYGQEVGGVHEWPKERKPVDLYRGVYLDLNHPDLAPVRRSLMGPQLEDGVNYGKGMTDKDLARADPRGYDNKDLGEHILNHVKNNPVDYQANDENNPHSQYGLGPHWTTDPSQANVFAGHTNPAAPNKVPAIVRAKWKGLGEDPYRSDTAGSWSDEKEITMLPGANMNVDSVKIQHPQTKQWHEVLQKPAVHQAAVAGHKRALVVVDPQNDFISGSLPVTGGEQVAKNLGALMNNPHHGYDHIVTTQDWHHDPGTHWSDHPDFNNSWPVHGKEDTWGAALHPAVANAPVSERFYKGQNGPGYSGFEGITKGGQGLSDWLQNQGVGHVDVAGLALDKCVHATARDAASQGFHTRVLPHYSAPVTPEGGKKALADLATNHHVEIGNDRPAALPQTPSPPSPPMTARRRGSILTHAEMRS